MKDIFIIVMLILLASFMFIEEKAIKKVQADVAVLQEASAPVTEQGVKEPISLDAAQQIFAKQGKEVKFVLSKDGRVYFAVTEMPSKKRGWFRD